MTPPGIGSSGEIALAHVAFVSVAGLTSSHAGAGSKRRIEECLLKPERFENLVLGQRGERLPAPSLQQERERDESQVAVADPLAGEGLEHLRRDRCQGLLL